MMEITRDVILDLLPLYFAGEVSADTRSLIEEYLSSDQELAKFAERSIKLEQSGEVPIPLTKDHEMKAYEKAKLRMFLFIIITGGMVSVVLIALLAFFMLSS